MNLAQAILATLQSHNVRDSNLEDANVVDVISDLAVAMHRAANAIYPQNTWSGHDATGGTVASLTEAVMGVTAGLVQIAGAIADLAEAVREGKQ